MKKSIKIVLVFLLLSAFFLTGCGSEKDAKKLTRYQIFATYDAQNLTLDATQTVNFINRTEFLLDEVCFHLYPSAFRENARFKPVEESLTTVAYNEGVNFGGVTIKNLAVEGEERAVEISGDDENILVVPLDRPLYPNDEVKISFDFTLKIPKVRHRFGHSDGVTNLGNWYPVVCAIEEGKFVTAPYYCIGDPFYSDCADYQVELTLPENLVVASSGSGKREGEKYSFTAKSVRDFALAIAEFKTVEQRSEGVTVKYYYQKDADPQANLDTATRALQTFGELFGEYPYETYSIVETELCCGGMEYPALSMLNSALNRSLYTETIIHETAHQWWYALVGNDEVTYPWLDEALAEYSTSLFYEKHPDYGVDPKTRRANNLAAYMLYIEKEGVSDDMTRPIYEYENGFEYSYSAYLKGEIMFSSVRSLLGDEKFFKSLKNYQTAYRYRIAKPDDLIGAFEKTANRELASFFNAWLNGEVKTFNELSPFRAD